MANASHVSRALSERGFITSSSSSLDDGAGRYTATTGDAGTVLVFPAEPVAAFVMIEALRDAGYSADRMPGSAIISVSGSPRTAVHDALAASADAVDSPVARCLDRDDRGRDRCDAAAVAVVWGSLYAKEQVGPKCMVHLIERLDLNALGPLSGPQAITWLDPAALVAEHTTATRVDTTLDKVPADLLDGLAQALAARRSMVDVALSAARVIDGVDAHRSARAAVKSHEGLACVPRTVIENLRTALNLNDGTEDALIVAAAEQVIARRTTTVTIQEGQA